MEYRSEVAGKMTFSRPLKPSEAAKLNSALNDDWSVWELAQEVAKVVDEEEGITIIRRRYTGLELAYDDEGKTIGYGWEQTFQHIIDQLPEDVTVSGCFTAYGEGGQGWRGERLFVRGHKVLKQEACIVWPDLPDGVNP